MKTATRKLLFDVTYEEFVVGQCPYRWLWCRRRWLSAGPAKKGDWAPQPTAEEPEGVTNVCQFVAGPTQNFVIYTSTSHLVIFSPGDQFRTSLLSNSL